MTNEDLIRLLHSTEHSFVERKTVADQRDWVKTMVGFANTLDTVATGVLFIGATDNGQIQTTDTNLDKLQKTFSDKAAMIYPAMPYTTQIVTEDGRECLAILVNGSHFRPHFAGPPYLRDGSQTIVPSGGVQFDRLISARESKAFEIQRWIGKQVTLRLFSRKDQDARQMGEGPEKKSTVVVVDCNQFYVTLKFQPQDYKGIAWSPPLGKIEIAFDHVGDRLELQTTLRNSNRQGDVHQRGRGSGFLFSRRDHRLRTSGRCRQYRNPYTANDRPPAQQIREIGAVRWAGGWPIHETKPYPRAPSMLFHRMSGH
jgi:Putative DNA-binding domain